MGRIPIAESDIGIWYPIDDAYYFMQINNSSFDYERESWEKHKTVGGKSGLRTSTFAEFKIKFPYTVYPNGSQARYRMETECKKNNRFNMIDKEIEEYLLNSSSDNPILRKLMNKHEIRIANKLVNDGLLNKGTSDDKQKSVCYYNIKN